MLIKTLYFILFYAIFYCYLFRLSYRASLVAQQVKMQPAMWETRVWSLGWEDPLEKGKATHSSILTWRISPWCHKESDMTKQLSLSFHTQKQGSHHYPLVTPLYRMKIPCESEFHVVFPLLFFIFLFSPRTLLNNVFTILFHYLLPFSKQLHNSVFPKLFIFLNKTLFQVPFTVFRGVEIFFH